MNSFLDIDEKCINAIRFLSVDMVQAANSGHPGAPMGAAAMAYTLWDRHLRHSPKNPGWHNRDRFVLSMGHAAALLYSLLYLTGYNITLDDLKNFRQWESKAPGHPEYGRTPGVEITTGPLGQGFASAVGMAIAEKHLAAEFNKSGLNVIDHFTYVMASDGDMQEGVCCEAASLAGTLKLGKLICLYDKNDIQIEGNTSTNFTEDVGKRFEAYGWQVIGPVDGMSVDAVDNAIIKARAEKEKPSLIICRTIIGYGSPGQGTCSVHGAPLGDVAVKESKKKLGWPAAPLFYVPYDVTYHMQKAVEDGREMEASWQLKLKEYAQKYPESARELSDRLEGKLPENWDMGLGELFPAGSPPVATRSASGKILNLIAGKIKALMGGSADLAPSNLTMLSGEEDFSFDNPAGRNVHFGVREHAMAAIANGMALHGGIIPYTGTFLVFSDYMRPSIRLAAMMGLRIIYIFTHDSIGLGEDGPTHQPVEHLMSLRSIPNLTVIRPADATEVKEAYRVALLNENGPTALVLTRQNLPVLDRSKFPSEKNLHKGAYVLWESSKNKPDVIIIASGSEVHLALAAAKKITLEKNKNVRVVSMPSWELFDAQDENYKKTVLPPEVRKRIAVEAGIKQGWEKYTGLDGTIIGMDSFGASAPYQVLYEKFGITAEMVAEKG